MPALHSSSHSSPRHAHMRRWPPTPAAAVLSSSRLSLLKFEVSGGNGDSPDIAQVVRGREGLPLSPPPPQRRQRRRRRRVGISLQVVHQCRSIRKPGFGIHYTGSHQVLICRTIFCMSADTPSSSRQLGA